jgi:hypothetical protein
MSDVYDVNERMHKLRVKLYPNYLPSGEETFIARTINEAAVSVEEICAAMKNRAGYPGSVDELIQSVHHFFKEMEYQLADGFAVNTGLSTIHVNLRGTFHSDKDPTRDHALDFRFQPLKRLRDLREQIDVIIDGYADANAYIAEFVDTEEDFINTQFVIGNMFTITGHNIKIVGNDPKCGVYFVPVNAPQDRLKVDRIGENTAGRVTGIVPNVGHTENRVEIVTMYSGSGPHILKAPRTLTSPFILSQV